MIGAMTISDDSQCESAVSNQGKLTSTPASNGNGKGDDGLRDRKQILPTETLSLINVFFYSRSCHWY